MTENHARLSPALVETIAGLSAGTISTLVVHPLDVIKTRLQIHRTTLHTPLGGLAILRALTANERPIQSLYRGLTPNLIGNASSWALFFYFKSITEQQLNRFHSHSSAPNHGIENGRRAELSALDYFLASGISGLMTTFTTNPIWVLKTRMLSSDIGTRGAYTSMWQGAREVWRNEGARGFYKGVGVSCLGVSHGAVQFAVYEPLKKIWRRYIARRGRAGEQDWGRNQGQGEEKLSNAATLVISATAKIVAGTATYPYQVLRSRLQTYDSEERFGRGIRGVAAKVWREDGLRGFYKGVGTNMLRVLPATWATFLVYENVKFSLPHWVDEH